MNRIACAMTALAGIATAAGTAHAADLNFQPRVEAGIMNYTFEVEPVNQIVPTTAIQEGFSFTQEAFEYSDTIFFAGAGLTLFANRFFVDISAQKAFSGDDNDSAAFASFIERVPGSTSPGFVSADPNFDADFDRIDAAISFGYAVTDQLAVFVGYKWAETEFDTKSSGSISAFFPNFVLEDGSTADITQEGSIRGRADYDFQYDGPFVGATYGWPIERGALTGVLSANLAIAFLQGEVDVDTNAASATINRINGIDLGDESFTIDASGLGSNIFETDGDTLGFTFGVGWRGLTPVEGLTYALNLSGYKYEFDADDSATPNTDETAIIFKAGVSYSF